MRLSSMIIAGLSAGAVLAAITAASAQEYSNSVVAECSRSVAQFKFEGWPADRNRDMMMLACEQNGGIVPGGPQADNPAAVHQPGIQ